MCVCVCATLYVFAIDIDPLGNITAATTPLSLHSALAANWASVFPGHRFSFIFFFLSDGSTEMEGNGKSDLGGPSG